MRICLKGKAGLAERPGEEGIEFSQFWPIFRKSSVVSVRESVQKRKIRSVFSSHFAERCSPLKVMTFFLAGPFSRPAIFLEQFQVPRRCRRRADPASFNPVHSPVTDRDPCKEGEVS
jgi:hypothetical protein